MEWQDDDGVYLRDGYGLTGLQCASPWTEGIDAPTEWLDCIRIDGRIVILDSVPAYIDGRKDDARANARAQLAELPDLVQEFTEIESLIATGEITRADVDNELDHGLLYVQPDPEGWIDEPRVMVSFYLGSSLDCPSGKYYLPFACSNVTPCPLCKGNAHIPNANVDAKTHKTARRARATLMESCFQRFGPFADWPQPERRVAKALDQVMEYHAPRVVCPACEGESSIDVLLDQEWFNELDRVVEPTPFSVQAGEGCATDLFLTAYLEYPTTEA